ncbi:MAG: hypothetical protein PHP26_09790, partial [Syntrophomonas sp.]|nr:hypothetical protein [Syntrophomonas sp.]
ILFLLLYLPLSKTSLFEQGGIIAVLIYGHLVMVLNVHDGFAAIFAKEGNKIIYLLPRFISWLGWPNTRPLCWRCFLL